MKNFEAEMTNMNLNTDMNSLFDVESEPMIMSRMKRSNKRKNKLTLVNFFKCLLIKNIFVFSNPFQCFCCFENNK